MEPLGIYIRRGSAGAVCNYVVELLLDEMGADCCLCNGSGEDSRIIPLEGSGALWSCFRRGVKSHVIRLAVDWRTSDYVLIVVVHGE
jgi:hypothetical protein